jgi:hypothetical protein
MRLLAALVWGIGIIAAAQFGIAGEVDLEEGIRTLDGVQIFQADGRPDEFYYLPTDIRFALDDKNEPAFMLLKYNLPTDQTYTVSDLDGSKKKAKQGGILAFEVTFTLSEERRAALEKQIRQQTHNDNATLALMPIDEASISLEYIDPATQAVKVKFAPETAPLSGNSVAFLLSLSPQATDIMWDAFSQPSSTAILTAKLAFKYTGYISPLQVKVSGHWENVFTHTSWNLNASGGVWFFRARADIQKVFEKMQMDGTLKVEWKGGANQDAQKLVDRLTDSIIPAMFDTTFAAPENPAKAEPTGGFFGGVSFAYKSVDKRRVGNFIFSYDRKDKVSRSDARSSRFKDVGSLTANKETRDRHFRTVVPGDWGVVAPRIFVNADLQKYSKVAVTVRYDQTNPETAVFSSETGGKNIVPREWAPDRTRRKDEQYVYEYSIQAQLKDNAFPANQVPKIEYSTDWIKSDKPLLMLSPKDWAGPQRVQLTVGPMIDFSDKQLKRALVKVTWNDVGTPPSSKTFVFNTGEEKPIFESFSLFRKDGVPKYEAEITYWEKQGTKRGPYRVKQGDAGADADELTMILSGLSQ